MESKLLCGQISSHRFTHSSAPWRFDSDTLARLHGPSENARKCLRMTVMPDQRLPTNLPRFAPVQSVGCHHPVLTEQCGLYRSQKFDFPDNTIAPAPPVRW